MVITITTTTTTVTTYVSHDDTVSLGRGRVVVGWEGRAAPTYCQWTMAEYAYEYPSAGLIFNRGIGSPTTEVWANRAGESEQHTENNGEGERRGHMREAWNHLRAFDCEVCQ